MVSLTLNILVFNQITNFYWFCFRDGDITTLEVDAITNTTDETLTESNIISERILNVAGNQLKEDLTHNIRGNLLNKNTYKKNVKILPEELNYNWTMN